VSVDLLLNYVVLVLQRSEELLEEVILSRTLNCLRGDDGDVYNSCTTFIETIEYVFHLICSKGFPYCNYLGSYRKKDCKI
jgi:hypothetical protein